MSSICESRVTVVSLLAGIAWAVGGLVIVLGLLLDVTGVPALGLWISGWGGVLTMRYYYECAEKREKAAFELGRRVGSDDNVSRI